MLNTADFGDALRNASLVWRESVMGGAAMAVFVLIGWRAGRDDDGWLVQAVRWWLIHVLGLVLGSSSWLRRSLLIAVNNAAICFVVVLLGSLGHLAWLGIAGVGLGLGVALMMMSANVEIRDDTEPTLRWNRRVLRATGMVLNLLEVPAVILCAGLSLAQGALSSSLSLSGALTAFCYVVLPLLVVSAAGEALWMTLGPKLEQVRREA